MDRLLNRAARRRHSGQTGFTLIELLVVIAVLAVLAAIVVFNVTGVTDKGKTSACQTDLHTVQTASDAYYNANTAYAATVAALAPTYIHNVPTDLGTVTINSDGKGTVTATAC
jgi:general secretion pathway protein G